MKTRASITILLLLILFIFASFFNLSGIIQTRDYWLKTERKGTGFANEHITIRTLENGSLEYSTEQLIKTDVAGLNPQDMIQKCSYIVDSDLLPISLDVHIEFRAKKAHITGKCENGIMHLTIEDEEGKVLEREIPFEETYFDAVLADLILRRESEKIFILKIFNPVQVKVNETQVEISKSDRTGVGATVTDRITRKYRIDRQGRIRDIEFVELHSRAYLTDAGNAQKINYLNTADGYTLTVTSQKSFPDVYNVVHAEIQVKWKDIPYEFFNFEDNRQKVVKTSLSNNEYEVILEITRPTPPSMEIKTPVKEKKFAAFLEETDYIKPSDPSIQQLLAEIQGNEKNAYAIVQNILHWIQSNIEVDMIAETLTGPEVLEKRKGKCSEYAVLFASLARAAGVPTRIALGEANNGNQWTGCMWNEVWLGGWIAVDPSGGIFITGPSHLKFVDSPTVMGTQKVRWKLVDNLSIEILDFKEEEK